jgi:hypothetical protein
MSKPADPNAKTTEQVYAYIASISKQIIATPSYLAIYNEAKTKHHWIYDPSIKRWMTPEELKGFEERISGGEPNRLARFQIKDPMEGIEAGYIQLQSLKERMEIFVKRVIEYYKK